MMLTINVIRCLTPRLIIDFLVKTIETGRTMCHPLLSFFQRNDGLHPCYFVVEVADVYRFAVDQLVKCT